MAVVDPGQIETVFRQSAAISRFWPYFAEFCVDQEKIVMAKLGHWSSIEHGKTCF